MGEVADAVAVVDHQALIPVVDEAEVEMVHGTTPALRQMRVARHLLTRHPVISAAVVDVAHTEVPGTNALWHRTQSTLVPDCT